MQMARTIPKDHILATRYLLYIGAEVLVGCEDYRCLSLYRLHDLQRIRRGAEAFLATHPEYADFDIRFDAILIESPFKIKHIENAF